MGLLGEIERGVAGNGKLFEKTSAKAVDLIKNAITVGARSKASGIVPSCNFGKMCRSFRKIEPSASSVIATPTHECESRIWAKLKIRSSRC
jgi:hypothetical protein